MRQLLDFLITGFILWAAARLFPTNITINGLGTLVLVTLLYYSFQTLVAFACAAIVFIRVWYDNSFTDSEIVAGIIILLTILMVTGAVAFSIIGRFIEGFWVDGIKTSLLLSVIISIFTTKPQPKKKH